MNALYLYYENKLATEFSHHESPYQMNTVSQVRKETPTTNGVDQSLNRNQQIKDYVLFREREITIIISLK